MDGISAVYFAYPVQHGLLDATVNLAVAARNAGVRRLIDMVMLVSAPDAPASGRKSRPEASDFTRRSQANPAGPRCA